MPTLGPIASAIANVFGLIRDRGALRNTPPMQAAGAAKTDAAIRAESTTAVAKAKTGDDAAIEKLRRLTAE